MRSTGGPHETSYDEASRGFAAAELRTGEADAQALLALCAEAQGDNAERDSALDRARTLRQAMTSRQEVYVVDIALAQVAAATPTDGEADNCWHLRPMQSGGVSWPGRSKPGLQRGG